MIIELQQNRSLYILVKISHMSMTPSSLSSSPKYLNILYVKFLEIAGKGLKIGHSHQDSFLVKLKRKRNPTWAIASTRCLVFRNQIPIKQLKWIVSIFGMLDTWAYNLVLRDAIIVWLYISSFIGSFSS